MTGFPGTATGVGVIRRVIVGQRRAIVRIIAWSVVEAAPALASGLTVSSAIDRFLARDITAGMAALGVLVAAAGVGALATRRLFPLLAGIVEPLRDELITAVAEGAVAAAVTTPGRADTASVARLTEHVDTVRYMSFALLRSMRQTAVGFLAAMIGLALLAPLVALATTCLVAVSLALAARSLPGLAERHRDVLLAEEEVARRGGDILAGARDALACGGQDRATAEVSGAVDEEMQRARSLARAAALRRLVVFVAGQAPLLAFLAVAPWLLAHRSLSLGEVVGAATYLTATLEPGLRSLVDVVWGWGLDLVVHLARLGEGFVPLPPPEVSASPAAGPRDGARYDITVEDLRFAYGPHAAPVVEGLTLEIRAGEHLAIVGPSGIGKSTLANLLAGLLSPQRGRVSIGGVDTQEIAEAALRATIGLIPQEAYVFAGTLRENITYLAPLAPEEALDEAVAEVGLDILLERLGGLDALVGAGGADLSTGERQLVALTRTYLSSAPIIVLDEATSNLDPVAEARAESAFARRGGTLIVIAHRITSARRARRILLLDGDRPEWGTHEELVAASSLYADLVGHWERANVRQSAGSIAGA